MKKNVAEQIFFVFSLAILLLGIVFAFFGGTKAEAINPFDITYPIVELGNCSSQEECKNFCDAPENQKACVDWAEHSGLISTEEAMKIREMRELEEIRQQNDFRGPGGCSSREECDAYCEGPDHLEECLQFSVDEGFMTQEEMNEIIEKVNRGGPGGCKSREECDAFCREPENNQICMQFAVDEGEMTQEEADFMIEMMERHEQFDKGPRGPKGPGDHMGPSGPRGPGEDVDEEKAIKIVQDLGGGPGGCMSLDECDKYCSQPENDEECMNFAIEHELFPPEEIEIMKKVMKEGGPGGCRGPEECDKFCSSEENQEVCFKFAKEHNLIPPEEVEMVEKMMKRGGPGGCKGERECDDYCRHPDHAEECMKFSVEMGMMTQEEADKMLQFMKKMDERDRMRDMERERTEHEFEQRRMEMDHQGEPYHDDMRGPGFFDDRMGPPSGYDLNKDGYYKDGDFPHDSGPYIHDPYTDKDPYYGDHPKEPYGEIPPYGDHRREEDKKDWVDYEGNYKEPTYEPGYDGDGDGKPHVKPYEYRDYEDGEEYMYQGQYMNTGGGVGPRGAGPLMHSETHSTQGYYEERPRDHEMSPTEMYYYEKNMQNPMSSDQMYMYDGSSDGGGRFPAYQEPMHKEPMFGGYYEPEGGYKPEPDIDYTEPYQEEPSYMHESPKDESMFDSPVGVRRQSLLGTVLMPFLNLFR